MNEKILHPWLQRFRHALTKAGIQVVGLCSVFEGKAPGAHLLMHLVSNSSENGEELWSWMA
jgi:hypothetical protein